jgi:hypothetical protein
MKVAGYVDVLALRTAAELIFKRFPIHIGSVPDIVGVCRKNLKQSNQQFRETCTTNEAA